MPDQEKAKRRKLIWLERVLFLTGMALVLAFLYIKSEQNHQLESGLQAFYQNNPSIEPEQAASLPSARPTETPAISTNISVVNRPASGTDRLSESHSGGKPSSVADRQKMPAAGLDDTLNDNTGSGIGPDQTLWSEKRIHEYQQSLALVQDRPEAVLKIDTLDIEVPVYNGTDDLILNRGLGRIIGTARFDQPGNLGLAGHRDGFFRGLKDIEIGDEILLHTDQGTTQYRVDSIVIVEPTDVSVLAPTEKPTLTLVTCYPFYFVGSAPQRFIVKATSQQLLAIH